MYSIGIVMKIKGKKSIILTETGVFEEINAREGMFLGQKIVYSQQEVIKKRRVDFNYFYPAIASIAAVFILLFSYINLFYGNAPFAYVDIDINPSIEFAVDNKGIILSEQPLNQEAIELMTNVTYEDKHLEDAIIDLIKKSKEHGYLKENGEKDIILISVAIDSRKKLNDNDYRIINELANNLRTDFIRLNQDIDVRFVEVSTDLRKRAVESKVSMGRYFIYEKALQEGKDISLEMLASISLKDLLSEDGLGLTEPTNASQPSPSDNFYESTPTDRIKSTPTPTDRIKSTPTPTDRIKSTPTPTDRIKPTSTPTDRIKPTPTHASNGKQGIKVQFYNNNEVSPSTSNFLRIKVENTGNAALDLSDIKLRYYYTIDGYSDQIFICDWASIGAHNVTGRFEKMSSSRPGADTFLEIGFSKSAGVLEPGSSLDMNIRYSKTDLTEYNFEDDYSFKSMNYVFEDWDKITAYISGVLKWGREP
ncbi:MAG: anti-sigma factor domain-containing protein [Clostridium sp.]|nr:anti-sigma factor domain-containing protein [Clostridium sp.]